MLLSWSTHPLGEDLPFSILVSFYSLLLSSLCVAVCVAGTKHSLRGVGVVQGGLITKLALLSTYCNFVIVLML